MKLHLALTLALGLTAASAAAQAPAGAPAGANGVCKDGTYSMAAVKSGACNGHKGVQTWFGPAAATAATSKPTAVATPATAPTPAPAPAAKSAPKRAFPAPPANAAPGGGPGMVWVNSSTKVYHCPGDRYYGKTKSGSYMTEAAAKSAGFKADASKRCK